VANLFTSQTPSIANVSEAQPVTIATTFTVSANGNITGGRFYAPTTTGAGTFELALWQITADDSPAASGTGTLLATASFGTLTAGTWNSVAFSSAVAVTTGIAYRIGVRTSEGRYTATGAFFNSAALTNGNLTGPQTGTDPVGIGPLDNGSFIESITAYPNKTFNGNCYFVDPDFTTGATSISLAEAGAASDVLVVAAAAALAEAGSAAEARSTSAVVPLADAAAGAQTLAAAVSVGLGDTGAAADAGSGGDDSNIQKALGDTGSASERLRTITARPNTGITARPNSGITPRP
jgi:hypothetical protein